MADTPQYFDLVTMGRIGVDLYPLQTGVPLSQVETFGKFLGGSAANVAVAAARLGRSAAVITRTGDDPFGTYLHEALKDFGVDDRWVTPVAAYPTPVTFCEIFPPDDFPLYFYRRPKAPDLEIHPHELDLPAIRAAGIFWVTGTGLSEEPSRTATLAALQARAKAGTTVFDLDWRPMFWKDPDQARPYYREALRHATVAVGNLDECEVATGVREPEACAEALLAAGVELAVVKQGPRGCWPCTGTAAGPRCPRCRSRWSTASAPATPSAVRSATVCSPAGTWSGPCATPTRPAPSSPRASPARPPCRPRRRSPASSRGTRRAGRPSPERSPSLKLSIPELTTVRARHPEAVAEAAARRARRPLIGDSGRLMIVAADHPARGALGIGDRRLAMADRADLLERLCVALSRPGVDGVLATADILEDLLLLGALENKVVMGSMNRGGLAGASFEMDDRFTGHRAEDIQRLGFDAGKLLVRIDYDDPGSLATLEASARAVDAMAARRLPVFVEPFISRRVDGRVRNDLSAEAVTRSIAIASGLGGTSAYTWLKLPVTEHVDDMEAVLRTSTLPVVLLGGEVGDQEAAYERWGKALRLPTVQGMVVGRSLLYPAEGSVETAVDTAVGLL